MYFIYQKTFNVATEYNYDIDQIFEFFRDQYSVEEMVEEYGENVTAQDILDYIWLNPDYWYDAFLQRFDIEEELRELDDMDLANQICEAINERLHNYYEAAIKEYKENL